MLTTFFSAWNFSIGLIPLGQLRYILFQICIWEWQTLQGVGCLLAPIPLTSFNWSAVVWSNSASRGILIRFKPSVKFLASGWVSPAPQIIPNGVISGSVDLSPLLQWVLKKSLEWTTYAIDEHAYRGTCLIGMTNFEEGEDKTARVRDSRTLRAVILVYPELSRAARAATGGDSCKRK